MAKGVKFKDAVEYPKKNGPFDVHSFATHLLDGNHNIHTVKELLGHENVKTAMIYTHVLHRGKGVKSPWTIFNGTVRYVIQKPHIALSWPRRQLNTL
jgi:hypothetical protein